jgi:tetratricopeptide (TPR) repeat protein
VRRFILICFYFVLPVAFWPGSTTYEAVKLTLLALTAAALMANCGWIWRRRRTLDIRPSWLMFTGAGLVGLALLSLARAANRPLVWQGVALLVLWLWVALTTSEFITSRHRLRQLLMPLVVGCSLAGLYGMLQIIGLLPGAPPATGMPPGISSLGNQNYLAGLAAVVFYPSLLLWRTDRAASRWVAVMATTILAATVIMCGAAGPLLALAAVSVPLAGGLLLIFHNRPRGIPAWSATCLVAGIGLAAGAWFLAMQRPTDDAGGQPGLPNPTRALYENNAGRTRVTDWAAGIQMLRSHPLTGVGLNNYKVAWPEHRARLAVVARGADWLVPGPRATKAHNEYIHLFAETGAAGILLLLTGGTAILLGWRRRFLLLASDGARSDFLLLVAGFSTAALHGLVSFPAHLPATTAALALLCGALASPRYGASTPGRLHASWHPAASWLLIVIAVLVGSGAVREMGADLRQRSGQDLLGNGRFEEAKIQLDGAIGGRLWPGIGKFYAAMSHRACGENGDVERLLRSSLRSEPSYEAHLQLAEVLRDRQAFAEALHWLDQLDRCEPLPRFQESSRYVRATVLLRRGDQDAARAILQDLLRESPTNHRALVALGYQEALAGQTELAAAHYRQALRVIDDKLRAIGAQVRSSARDGGIADPGSGLARALRLRQQRDVAARALSSVTPTAE